MDDCPARRAARWYSRMASFHERRADELARQSAMATARSMVEVLMQGSERARHNADLCRRAMLAEMTAEEIAGDSQIVE